MSTPEKIDNPRAIVDRRALMGEAETVARLPDSRRRAALLALLKKAMKHGQEEIRRRFDANNIGGEVMRASALLVDQVVRVLFDFASLREFPAPNPTKGEQLSIVAVGGYGRGELAPRSDVDLLFLLPYKQTPRGEQIVEYMLYVLWDLGLQVGHATRSIDECLRQAKADMTIRTGLLESRFIWGDQDLYRELKKKFDARFLAGNRADFIEAKLKERDERHQRLGDSRYVLEPNIKDGKGGLRDLHTLTWLAKYLYKIGEPEALVARGVLSAEEARTFVKSREFLWCLRCHLHYSTGRPEERLTFDVQSEIARRMGYTDHAGTKRVERLMKHYFLVAKDVGDLTRVFCAAIDAETKRAPLSGLRRMAPWRRDFGDFVVDQGRLDAKRDNTFLADPVNFLRLFQVAQANGLDLHPQALRLVRRDLRLVNTRLRQNPEANRLFLEMLTSEHDPETTLRRMNEAGVLGRFVPDFGRVVAQMQYDMYHVHTVDEHTIYAIGILHRIEKGLLKEDHPVSSEVVHKILSRRVLYLAVLLHDIAKGRGGDHSVLGEQVANELCPRLGLSEEETATVAWLVRYHLLMSYAAFKRDIDDPKTVADFCALVQSPERLRLLLVLTVADIRAVGPNVWNNWKATLLRELYWRAEEALSGGLAAAGKGLKARAEARLDELRGELKDWTDAEFAHHRERCGPAYWLGFDTQTLARHARMIRRADREQAPLSVDTKVDRPRAITEVTIYTEDHPGLFSRIAGALALSGANIVEARIFTTNDGMALDTFSVQGADGGAFDRPDKLARLATRIEQSLSGKLMPRQELAKPPAIQSRTRVFKVPPRVLIDNKASATHTVVEVNGRDRPGLLYDVTRALTASNLQISSARISTYGESVVDVFYVKDIFGMKVDEEHKLAKLREQLLAALADPAPATAAPPEEPPARRRTAPARARVAAE
ncbi:MAG: [protein-PII] uridylyltransferase [Alphaproteobacteria bacterium]|nr:[protein-PII] uridylyltransferase [Alphaproteobacteria bacterium]